MLQYFHDQIGRKTIALDVPDKNSFEQLLQVGTSKYINLNCGYSLVHPNDRYEKSIGREISKQYLESQTFQLIGANFSFSEELPINNIYLELINEDRDADILKIFIKLVPEASRAHFIDATFNYFLGDEIGND